MKKTSKKVKRTPAKKAKPHASPKRDIFAENFLEHPSFDFAVDISKMDPGAGFLASFEARFRKGHREMAALEKGAIANPDEKRRVGHYWLRDPDRAPERELTASIRKAHEDVRAFAAGVLDGRFPGSAGPFQHLLLVGIGGSALGPQFIHHALRPAARGLEVHFLDNTDPDGMDRVLDGLKGELGSTVTVVISKSGGTKETRNGMAEARAAYTAAGLDFTRHAVAVTGESGELKDLAVREKWLATFPMWDWVGGRTSVMSAVGLLPMALAGYDTVAFLDGAREMDEWTRAAKLAKNPAGLLAAMWHKAGHGRGEKDMVILPYKDRLELFSRYLQQLVMESLGKELDLHGRVVHQGIAVYGNKGSTDQHAYVQQLRDGVHNFFVVFIEVKKSRSRPSVEVEPGAVCGDFLEGFYLGTRRALHDSGRSSITVTLDEVNERTLGRLIALFERAVGYYASFVGINAYHQPGVEAGKKAAGDALAFLHSLKEALAQGGEMTAKQVAAAAGRPGDTETAFKLLEYLCANPGTGVVRIGPRQGLRNRYRYGA